jgi:hypothetical protein
MFPSTPRQQPGAPGLAGFARPGRGISNVHLSQTGLCYRFVVLGYVVMPEHVHLLVSEPQRETLSTAIQALKLAWFAVCSVLTGASWRLPGLAKAARPGAPQFRAPRSPGALSLGHQVILTGSGRRGSMISMFGRSASGLKSLAIFIATRSSVGWEQFSMVPVRGVGPVRINDTDIMVMKIRPPTA